MERLNPITKLPSDYAQRLERERDALAAYERERVWRDTGIPARHRETRPTGPAPWMADCENIWSMLQNGSVVLCHGTRGTGKTQLAVEMVRRTVAEGESAKYIRLMEFYRAIKDTFDTPGASTLGTVKRYRQPWLLVIDECHERGASAWENRELNDLIDHRYGEMRPTLLISNYDRHEIAQVFGPSVVDRVFEGGGCVEMSGPSFRKGAKP